MAPIQIVALISMLALSVLALPFQGQAQSQASADPRDLVLIVYNSEEANDLKLGDKADSTIAAQELVKVIGSVSHDIEIRALEIAAIHDLAREVDKVAAGRNLKGLVFLGHGNQESYTFSKYEQKLKGAEMAEMIKPLLSRDYVSRKLALYYLACRLAGDKPGVVSFQEALFSKLSESLPTDKPGLEIEIVAHTYITETGAYEKPSIVDRFFARTGLPGRLERHYYSLLKVNWIRANSPELVMMAHIAAGIAMTFAVPDHAASIGFVTFTAALLGPYVMKTSRALGKTIGDIKRSGFVHDLIRQAMGASQCELLLRPRAN